MEKKDARSIDVCIRKVNKRHHGITPLYNLMLLVLLLFDKSHCYLM